MAKPRGRSVLTSKRGSASETGQKSGYPTTSYSEKEQELIRRASSRKATHHPTWPMSISYDTNKNFTKCVIVGKDRICFGVAKRNPQDADNPEVARSIAFYRAVTEQPTLLKK